MNSNSELNAATSAWLWSGKQGVTFAIVSHVHRLRTTNRIFFVTVNLRRPVEPFREREYPLMIEILESARRRLGFLLCG